MKINKIKFNKTKQTEEEKWDAHELEVNVYRVWYRETAMEKN